MAKNQHSFKTGNQWWNLRSKHGRDKLFATPDLMWEAAVEYFDWCTKNPLMEVQQTKSAGKPHKDKKTGKVIFPSNTIELPKMRAFTLHGLCLYLDANTQYFKTFKAQLKESDPHFADFNTVIARIEETIYQQKFTGAAAGFLNHNIIARDLGLQDNQKIEVPNMPAPVIVRKSK